MSPSLRLPGASPRCSGWVTRAGKRRLPEETGRRRGQGGEGPAEAQARSRMMEEAPGSNWRREEDGGGTGGRAGGDAGPKARGWEGRGAERDAVSACLQRCVSACLSACPSVSRAAPC